MRTFERFRRDKAAWHELRNCHQPSPVGLRPASRGGRDVLRPLRVDREGRPPFRSDVSAQQQHQSRPACDQRTEPQHQQPCWVRRLSLCWRHRSRLWCREGPLSCLYMNPMFYAMYGQWHPVRRPVTD
eukprot:SAG31_NODE_26345_length_444_cov_0.533333_1_plen_127_part_01